MSALPQTFAAYREATANSPGFNMRRTCTCCGQFRSNIDGVLRPIPGSRRKAWVCAGGK